MTTLRCPWTRDNNNNNKPASNKESSSDLSSTGDDTDSKFELDSLPQNSTTTWIFPANGSLLKIFMSHPDEQQVVQSKE